jgi:hypothetical protein
MNNPELLSSMKYHKDGYVQEAVAAIIFLIMGVGMATLVLIFVSVLGGQVYSQTAAQLLTINSTNTNVYGNVTGAIQSSFVALNTTGSYLPIVVLAVIIFLVLGLVMALTPGFTGGYGGGYGGSAL